MGPPPSEEMPPQQENQPGQEPPGATGAEPHGDPVAPSGQASPPTSESPEPAGGAADEQAESAFSSEVVDAFASAYIKMVQIQQQHQQALQSSSDPAQIQQVQQQASEQMSSVIQQEPNISIEQFQAIQAAVEHDPELRKEVERSIQNQAQ